MCNSPLESALLNAIDPPEPARTCGDCTGPEHFDAGPSGQRYCRKFGSWLPAAEPCAEGTLARTSR